MLFGMAVGLACGGAPLFLCSDSGDCMEGGVAGTCQPGGLCSFPDDDCATGQRYGDHAGNVSGECVPNVDPTGGTSSETTTTSAATSTTGMTSTTTSPVGDDTTTTGLVSSTGVSSAETTDGDETTGTPSTGTDSSGGTATVEPYALCGDGESCPSGWSCADLAGTGTNACIYQCSPEDPCPDHPDGLPVFCYEEMGFSVCLISCDPTRGLECPEGYACFEDAESMIFACVPD